MIGDAMLRPTNTCVYVDYGLRFHPLTELRETVAASLFYEAADGTRVALAQTEWKDFYCPTAALAPDTDYALVGPAVSGCGLEGEATLHSFHTTAGPDETAPTTPGPVDDVSCRTDSCDSSACCGPYTVTIYESVWAPSTDDLGGVAYAFGGELRFGARHAWYTGGGGASYGPLFGQVGTAVGLTPHRVRAIDGSGNTSEPAIEGSACEIVPDDAAVSADAATPMPHTVDAATSVDPADAGTTEGAGGGGGCSAHAARRDGPAAMALAFLAWLRMITRRRV